VPLLQLLLLLSLTTAVPLLPLLLSFIHHGITPSSIPAGA
jgi:hypothetical protein